MHTTRFYVIIQTAVFSCIFATAAFGQSFFSSGHQKTSTPAVSTAIPHPVVSPSDFKNMVNTTNQQTKSENENQFNQQLKKSANSLNDNRAMMATPIQTEETNTSIMNNTPSNGAVTSPPMTVTPPLAYPSQPSQPIPQGAAVSSSPAAASPPAPLTAPQGNQAYTGFGGGANTSGQKPTNSPSSGSSGGWNIKY